MSRSTDQISSVAPSAQNLSDAGLPAPDFFLLQLNFAIALAQRSRQDHAVIVLDVSEPHSTNKRTSSELCAIGQMLRNNVLFEGCATYLGEDQFALLLPAFNNPFEVFQTLQLFQRLLSTDDLKLNGRFGVALYPTDSAEAETLLEQAKEALVRITEVGTLAFANQKQQQSLEKILKQEQELQQAWNRGQFQLYYQPQVDVKSGKTKYLAANLYWQHPERGLLKESAFINRVARCGLLWPLSAWILRTIANEYASWQDAQKNNDVLIVVPLFSEQFQQEDLTEQLERLWQRCGIEPGHLILRVDESALRVDSAFAHKQLKSLKSLGVKLLLRSSKESIGLIERWCHWPVDILQVEQEKLHEMGSDEAAMGLLHSLTKVAREQGKEILMAGVDASEQVVSMLATTGTLMQGSAFSEPVKPKNVEALLKQDWAMGLSSLSQDLQDHLNQNGDDQQNLQQLQRLATSGTLACGLVHDFSNVLTSIDGYLHLLQESLPKEEPYQRWLSAILKASNHGSQLSEQILAFSQNRAAFEKQSVDLNVVLSETISLLRHTASAEVKTSLQVLDEPVYVRAVENQLTQCFVNLGLNAQQAMPMGGDLSMTLTQVDWSTPEDCRAELPIGQYACVVVIDTGVGIPASQLKQLFQPFFSTKEHGTGLGLTMVKTIVSNHGGGLEVSSVEGEGTTVTIYLPQE